MLNQSGIYKITNMINGKCYIGSACNFKRRWAQHKAQLRHNKHHSILLQRAWNKYGEENFEFKVMFTCFKEELIAKEQSQMNRYKPEYNASKVAGSCLGTKRTCEQRARMSEYLKGRIVSEETRFKISNSEKGKVVSKESVQKMVESLKLVIRKPHTDSAKLKMSISKKGRPALQSEIDRCTEMSKSNKGRVHTELAKENMRIAQLNRILSPEAQHNISSGVSKARSESKASEETRMKMSETQKLRWGRIHRVKETKFANFVDIEWTL